jgi:hypothetical protein
MPKFQIDLDDLTYEALGAMALEELRDLPRQAAWLLMQAMRTRQQHQEHSRAGVVPSLSADEGANYGP